MRALDREYYASPEWKQKKTRIIRQRGHRCERCGNDQLDLQLHHLTYARFRNEHDEDLQLLCRSCHEKADRVREENTRYANAKETYLTKKYGSGSIPSYADAEFDEWLERKQERDRIKDFY
jgi:5-methylcytosine-specific restriction endonuclease McrA